MANKTINMMEMCIEVLIPRTSFACRYPAWAGINHIVYENSAIKSGKYVLIINDGGIQNRISQQSKEYLKKFLIPHLMDMADITQPLTGRLELHLSEGSVRRAYLNFKCEEGHTITTIF